MRKGAYTYLTKPVNLDLLESVVQELLLAGESQPDGESPGQFQFMNIIGKSGPMQEVFSLIRRVSKTDANILILGESEPAKRWWQEQFITPRSGLTIPLSPSTARQFPPSLWKANCSVMKEALSPGPWTARSASLKWRRGGLCFLMKSAISIMRWKKITAVSPGAGNPPRWRQKQDPG
jgi:hypothetical protein